MHALDVTYPRVKLYQVYLERGHSLTDQADLLYCVRCVEPIGPKTVHYVSAVSGTELDTRQIQCISTLTDCIYHLGYTLLRDGFMIRLRGAALQC